MGLVSLRLGGSEGGTGGPCRAAEGSGGWVGFVVSVWESSWVGFHYIGMGISDFDSRSCGVEVFAQGARMDRAMGLCYRPAPERHLAIKVRIL